MLRRSGQHPDKASHWMENFAGGPFVGTCSLGLVRDGLSYVTCKDGLNFHDFFIYVINASKSSDLYNETKNIDDIFIITENAETENYVNKFITKPGTFGNLKMGHSELKNIINISNYKQFFNQDIVQAWSKDQHIVGIEISDIDDDTWTTFNGNGDQLSIPIYEVIMRYECHRRHGESLENFLINPRPTMSFDPMF